MNYSDQAINNLRKTGQKVTKARVAILELLSKSTLPLDPISVWQNLLKDKVEVNKSTVYREITFLIDQKAIKEVVLGDDKKRYELDTKDHHHHLVCLKCKNIQHYCLKSELLDTERMIRQKRKFQVLNHSLEFFGLCSRCQ